MRHTLPALALSLALASPALAQSCGGPLAPWLADLRDEAVASGISLDAAELYLKGARIDEKVLARDREQGFMRKPFSEFTRLLISQDRLDRARQGLVDQAIALARARDEFGIPGGILMAFWAFETDFGRIQGDFDTRDALVTLAHDCRRPDLFRPQLLAATELHARGDLPLGTTGAWAGEVGMVQMLPRDILARGVDGDGDGHVRLKTSAPDALLSGARMLEHHGWRAGEPWMVEVSAPDTLDWGLSGLDQRASVAEWQARGVLPREADLRIAPDLQASLLLPEGHKGPAFLVFDNFRSLFEWNQSMVYVTTAAWFATRIEGAPIYAPGTPEPLLAVEEMQALQERLGALGHDVGKADGVLGAGTRRAVQLEQARLGLPADGWPTKALLEKL